MGNETLNAKRIIRMSSLKTTNMFKQTFMALCLTYPRPLKKLGGIKPFI